jgi:hypothetical protein
MSGGPVAPAVVATRVAGGPPAVPAASEKAGCFLPYASSLRGSRTAVRIAARLLAYDKNQPTFGLSTIKRVDERWVEVRFAAQESTHFWPSHNQTG